MNTQEIEKLLMKYFNGETEKSEEIRIKKFFKNESVPPHLKSLEHYFDFLSNENEQDYLGSDFDEQITEKIFEKEIKAKRSTRRIYTYVITGLAASILIIFGLFQGFDLAVNRFQDTYSDPAVAYERTKEALHTFSKKFNSGLEPAKQFTRLNQGFNEASKIGAFKEGIEQASKAHKFYETQKKIFN